MKLGIQFGLKAKIGKEMFETQKEKQVANAESWMCYKGMVDYSGLQEHQEEKLWSGQVMRGIKMKQEFCSLCGQWLWCVPSWIQLTEKLHDTTRILLPRVQNKQTKGL